ncbi:hypothetical protein GCM10007385_36680 [Tateyamaria omphalii]|nr:hypothetical protein GCM10007385_36680 [Tateyamaria omphalii]
MLCDRGCETSGMTCDAESAEFTWNTYGRLAVLINDAGVLQLQVEIIYLEIGAAQNLLFEVFWHCKWHATFS